LNRKLPNNEQQNIEVNPRFHLDFVIHYFAVRQSAVCR